MGNEEIAYQNKDIVHKKLMEDFSGKTFRVYGLDLPKIKRMMPTNIPVVKVKELRIDNLFELEDGTMAVVDYESDYRKADKVKYLNYLTGIANRYQKEKKSCPSLRMAVIYTGDIKRREVSTKYDIGAVKMSIEPAFLSELDREDILQRLTDRVSGDERLTDDELMELIIFPLAYQKKEDKEKGIHEAVGIAANIQDRGQQLFALAGIMAFTDKVIDRETANKIRRAIEMTQVEMIIEEEKEQAVKQAIGLERKKNAETVELLVETVAEKDSILAEKDQELAKLRARIVELESSIK